MIFAYAYLVLINLLDYLSTKIMATREGLDIEANPYLRGWMIHAGSTYPILVAKMIPIVFLGLLLLHMRFYNPQSYRSPVWVRFFWIMNILFTIVVVRSFYMIFTV